MTELGIGTYAFAWSIGVPGYPKPKQPLDAVSFVRRCAALGVSLVQIADNIPLHTLTAAELDALEQEVTDRGMAVEVGTRGIAPDHLHTYLQLAQRFASPILRVVVDTANHHPDVPEIIATLRPMMAAFEAAGVTLAIENHDRFKSAALIKILESLNTARVGICLDTVNSFGCLEGPDVVIDTLGPYVVNLHIKDFTIARLSHNMGFELTGTPAGEGMLDVPSVVQRLRNFGREFNAILELWPAYTGDIEETRAIEATWAERSLAHLREIFPA